MRGAVGPRRRPTTSPRRPTCGPSGALPGFRGDSSARTWLLTIARRTCADDVRRRSRSRRLVRPGAGRDPGAASRPTRPVGWSWTRSSRELDEGRREAFVLTQVLGLDYAEAAEVCGCPIGTIRSRVARARADLGRVRSAGARGRSP